MENQNIYKDDEEIDLIALLITVARSWRRILAAGLIGAVLVCGLYAVKEASSKAKAEAARANGEEVEMSSAEAEYEKDLFNYYKDRADYDQQINDYRVQLRQIKVDQKTAETDLKNATEYSENSVLMNMDPYEVYSAQAVLYVDNDYKIMPESSYQNPDNIVPLLNAYVMALTDRSTLSGIAQQQDMEERYLEELITVTPDSETRFLTVQVISDGEDRSQAILDGLLSTLKNAHASIQRNIGTHEIKVLSNTSSVVVMTDLIDTQKVNQENLSTLEKSRDDLQDNYDLTSQSLKNAQRAIAMLTEPTEPNESFGYVKYALIGGVVCAFLMCFVAAVKFIASQKVYSGAELHNKTGLSVLGCLAGEKTKKEKGIDAWLSSLERRANGSADQETVQLIAATVSRLAPDAENILITGDLAEAQLTSLRDGLQATEAMNGKKLTAADSVLCSAQSVERIVAADEILLAVDCSKTYNADVRAQIEKIRALGKKILGCVVYE